jgi:hypothetical protein
MFIVGLIEFATSAPSPFQAIYLLCAAIAAADCVSTAAKKAAQ